MPVPRPSRLLACLGVVMLSGLAALVSSAPASAQVLYAAARASRVLPGLTGLAHPRLRAVSRDGSRVLVGISAAPGYPTSDVVVLDARTGALVFDSRVLASSTRRFSDALLTATGRTVVYSEVEGALRQIRVRDLETAAERVVFASHTDITLQDTNDDASVVAFLDEFARPGFSGPGRPVYTLGNPCGAGPVGGPVSLSADGSHGVYQRLLEAGPVIFDTATGTTKCDDRPLAGAEGADRYHLDGSGRWLAYTARVRIGTVTRASVGTLLDLQTGHRPSLPSVSLFNQALGVSDDARYVLLPSGVYDRRTRVYTGLAPGSSRLLSGDGRTVVSELPASMTPPLTGDDPTITITELDADRDGLDDGWEAAFRLDPSDPADGSTDPDGDGQTNAEEFAAGTHPVAAPVRYFAEGANGSFFATTLALFNPGDADLLALVRFLGPEGATESYPLTLKSRVPIHVPVDNVRLPFGEFSVVVEAPAQVVAERRMTWDRAAGYGSHASSGVEAPSTTWHFAEGATISGIQTFFLLQNPGATAATVTMRYLLSNGTPQARQHVVPARSRVTVWVNEEGAPMQAAEFATVVEADRPIVAERAVYRDVGAQVYGAGSAAAGVPAPLTEWSFAEGATGDVFDTYLLLANPSDQPVEATVRFETDFDRNNLGPTSTPVSRTYRLAPRARLTMRVADQDPMLAARQVSLLVTSTAPIVAERAMWWPGPTPATWAESHADTGAGPTGSSWAVADIQVDATSDGWDTFLLVNAPQSTGPLVRVRLACEDGTTADRTLALLPYRVTLWMRYDFPEIVGRRCGATLESLPRKLTNSPTVQPNRAPMRIEKAMYSGNFSAGTSTSATRLPEPVDPPS